MIFDLAAGDLPSADSTFDVCIVGAGAAGIILAGSLVRRGKRVLLLEAGGRKHERSAGLLTQGEVVGLPHRGINSARFRVLGGTTREWGGQILELDEIDFEKRSWVPGSGWPFRKAELLPFYDRVLDFVKLRPAILDDQDVWRALGVEPPDLGPDIVPAFSRWCPERNFARIEAKLLEEHESLHVYLHANACGLVLGEDGGSVRAVLCRTLNGREALFRAGQFVLAMGGIETSRFLLQVDRDTPGPLNRHGLLGTHFADHVTCSGGHIEHTHLNPRRAYLDYSSVGGLRYHPKFKLAPRAQAELDVLNVAGTVVFSEPSHERSDRASDALALIRQRRLRVADWPAAGALLADLPRRVWARVARRAPGLDGPGRMVLRVHSEQAPLNGSRITLSDQKDALGQFRARLDWRTSPLELDTVRRFVATMTRAFEDRKLGRIVPHPDLHEPDGRFVRTFEDSAHHMGGTRMADTPADGVVDRNLLIHGLRNTFICSSSVFPTCGFSNPTHTILALALRLGDHLAATREARPELHGRPNGRR